MLQLDSIPEPNFGCGPTDWSCMGQESLARFFVSCITALGNFMADMLTNAFKDSRAGDSSWAIAGAEFWFWVGAVGIVLACVAIVQLMPAMILRDGKRVMTIGLGLAAAIPSSVLAVWFMRQLSNYGNTVTDALMKSIQGEGLAQALLKTFGLTAADGKVSMNADSAMMTADGGAATNVALIGELTVTLVVLLVMALAALFLYISMAIRSFGLIALAATAPIGFMMVGQPKLAAWAHRWVNLALGLILAEPLAAGILVLSVLLLGHGEDMGQLWVAACAVFVAAFAPLWAVKLVSFAGRETASALSSRPGIRENANRASFVVKVAKFGR